MLTSRPPCFTSNSRLRTSGASTPELCKTEPVCRYRNIYDSRGCLSTGSPNLGAELPNPHPDSRYYPATQHTQQLSLHGPAFPLLSGCRVSAGPPAFPIAPRSPSARLVPQSVRTTSSPVPSKYPDIYSRY